MKNISIRFGIAAVVATAIFCGLVWFSSEPIPNPTTLPLAGDYDNAPTIDQEFVQQIIRNHPQSPAVAIPNKFNQKSHFSNSSNPPFNPTKGSSTQQSAIQTGQQIFTQLNSANYGQFKNLSHPLSSSATTASSNRPLTDQEKAIQALKDTLGSDAQLKMDEISHTLRFLDGKLDKLVTNSKEYHEARRQGDFGGMALALANQIPAVLNIQKPAEEFFAEDVSTDELGMTHVILQQQYRDAPVWGAEIGIHFNAQQEPYQISGVYAATPDLPIAASEISESQAIEAAQRAIGQNRPGWKEPTIQRMVYWDLGQQPVMCWNVELSPSFVEAWEIFVSTEDGSIVHRYSKIQSANAQASAADLVGNIRTFNCWQDSGKYYAIDTTLPMYNSAKSSPPDINNLTGVLLGLDFRNQDPNQEQLSLYRIESNSLTSWDPACVTLMNYYPTIDHYYRTTFNRNSINNEGLNIIFAVHFRWPVGNNTGQSHNENACWNPTANMMFYGDGDQMAGGKLPYALDVVAHEYTHGVTGFEAGLIYETQSGALDEAFSDFFACMIDREDWLLAEDIVPFGADNTKIAMRDMSYPGNSKVTDQNPAVMAEYQNLPTDYDHGGVHINCGIPSYMLYLLADGGDYAISKEKTEKIVYRARNEYLTQRSQFSDFRSAMITAARDLYGENSAEVEACKKAADAVGITEGGTTSPSTPGTIVQGDEMVLFLAADYRYQDPIRLDYYYNLYLNAGNGNLLLTQRYAAGSRPAVSGDGQWALYVDATNNIIMTNGFQEQAITNSGIVRTIAMNKNQRYISFTTINPEGYIYIIDLKAQNANQSVSAVPLRVALNSEYTSTVDLNYADVMTFNFRGDYLFFDAVQELQLASGGKIAAWGMYSIRLSDLKCDIVMQPQPNVEFGDPTFAHTDDSLLLADMVVHDNDTIIYNTVSIDFLQGKIGVLMKNTGILSRPSFRGDDKHIVFLTIDPQQQKYIIVEGELTADRLGYVENSLNLLVSAQIKLDFSTGFRAGQYESQEGKIALPASIDFGTIDLGQSVEKTFPIANQGNADLEILSITLEGDRTSWFKHNGLNQRISPGDQYLVSVVCNPATEGQFTGTLRVQSTDPNQPNVTMGLQGAAIPSAQASPTPTATVAPIQPTPTATPPQTAPTPTPTATPVSQPSIEPIAQFEFDQIDLANDGWKEIPGGFGNASPGSVTANSFVGQRIPSSQDKVGIQISVQSNQVAFLHSTQPVDTGGAPVLIRMSARADGVGAAVALAALKGNVSTGENLDGSIATHIPASAADLIPNEIQMVLVYEPDTSNLITPVIQVAAGSVEGSVNVFIDKLEIIKLDAATAYSGDLFGSAIGLGSIVNQQNIPPTDILYEFDQIDLKTSGWNAIPGGFTGANAGEVFSNSFVGQLIPSSLDKVGIQFGVDKNEVAFIHAINPIPTNNAPLLIRATLRANTAGANVALAALKGNLSTSEGVDGSIVTHIPTSAVQMVNGERTLTLVCPSNSTGLVTPILQVLGSSDQTAAVFVDRMEIYSLQAATGFPGRLFGSQSQ